MALEEVENKDTRLSCSMVGQIQGKPYVYREVNFLCHIVFTMEQISQNRWAYHKDQLLLWILWVTGVNRVAHLLLLLRIILKAAITWQLNGA